MRDNARLARHCALLHIYLASRSVSLLFHSWAFQNAESKVELLAKNKCMQSTLLDIMLEWRETLARNVDLGPQMVCEVHERYLPGVGRAYVADLKVYLWLLWPLHTIYYHFAYYIYCTIPIRFLHVPPCLSVCILLVSVLAKQGQKKLLGRVEHLRSGRNVIVSTGSLCVTPKWFANYQSRY